MNHDPVLLVEPDEQKRVVHRQVLQRAGYRVVEARTGEEAICVVCRERPRVIVMECRTPGVSGVRAAEVLKGEPRLRDIPILLLGSGAGDDEARTARAAGCDAYLACPCGPLVLLAELRRLTGASTWKRTVAPRRSGAWDEQGERGDGAVPRVDDPMPQPS